MEAGLSARNPRIQAAARLHRSSEREATGLTLLEGPKLVEEAKRAGIAFVELFSLDDSHPDAVRISEAALERLSSTRAPQSPVAVIAIPRHRLRVERSVLVAWEISDPGNLGTMIRTAAAFEMDVGVVRGADPWSPKTLRSAAGAHFHTAVVSIENPFEIGATTIATVSSGGAEPGSLPLGRLAIFIGNEAHGLPDEALTVADSAVSIPMPGGTESLNAAAAAAILCYEVARRKAGPRGHTELSS
ncbi:MAG TPA: RNA methyltransferase [Acidimicrobiia bacterium]|nr:RNA methyltransferase [Acidimicrobiia bacterium]